MTLAPLDTEAAAAFWASYASSSAIETEYTVERFGDSAELADDLLHLVAAGKKRATATLELEFTAENEPLPRLGAHWIIADSTGTPKLIVRTTGLRLVPFPAVDAAHAAAEAEQDGTLDSWRTAHRHYWERRCAALGRPFTATETVVLERFRVVHPPALAD